MGSTAAVKPMHIRIPRAMLLLPSHEPTATLAQTGTVWRLSTRPTKARPIFRTLFKTCWSSNLLFLTTSSLLSWNLSQGHYGFFLICFMLNIKELRDWSLHSHKASGLLMASWFATFTEDWGTRRGDLAKTKCLVYISRGDSKTPKQAVQHLHSESKPVNRFFRKFFS